MRAEITTWLDGTLASDGNHDHGAAAAMLDPCGAGVILGAQPCGAIPVSPIAAGADTLFAPRGAAIGNGALFVCDTGHHRLLGWSRVPCEDGTPADFVIGQPDLAHEGRNGGRDTGRGTLNVPTGIAIADDVVAVADAWNHRVLVWHGVPTRANQPPDIVLGQSDFLSNQPNRGKRSAGADTLNWCYGVTIDRGRLLVADTGNRRVLVWGSVPLSNGTPADLVLGQRDFTTRDEGGGEPAGGIGMRWPHAIARASDMLFVADAGSSRVMVWRNFPARNGAPCDFVLGQPDLHAADHNQCGYAPSAQSFNMPYGIAVAGDLIVVADTANSRLVAFDRPRLSWECHATYLAGQQNFTEKGENRWLPPTRQSLCWPYGVAASNGLLTVADSGNNRVLLWGLT